MWCQSCCNHGHFSVLRIILGLLIVMGAFWLGVKVGQLSTWADYGYGPMMRGWNGYAAPQGMMGGAGRWFYDSTGLGSEPAPTSSAR